MPLNKVEILSTEIFPLIKVFISNLRLDPKKLLKNLPYQPKLDSHCTYWCS